LERAERCGSPYRYSSTEEAIRVARQGARDTLSRLTALTRAFSHPSPEYWLAEAVRCLVEMEGLRKSPWPSAVEKAEEAMALPEAVEEVQSMMCSVRSACSEALPNVLLLSDSVGRALSVKPPDNRELFWREDLPMLLSSDPRYRRLVTRPGRITPTLKQLLADAWFRVPRRFMLPTWRHHPVECSRTDQTATGGRLCLLPQTFQS
jgi:hypothetical protein